MRWNSPAATMVLLVVALAGCGGGGEQAPAATPPPAKFKVSGTITVDADSASSEATMGGACVTDGGYADVQTGAQVTVSDAAGKVLALGALQAGHVSEVFDEGTAVEGMASLCVFGFAVDDVPDGEGIYSVEVSHRGKINFPREKLNSPVVLTLG